MTGKDQFGKVVEAPAKDKVDMAKFVVKTIESLNNTCLREEALILGIREKGNADGADQLEESQAQQTAESTGAFSMEMATDDQVKH